MNNISTNKSIEIKTAVIIVSDNAQRIKDCLEKVKDQTSPFEIIIIVGWGKERTQVFEKARSIIIDIIEIEADKDTTLEANRNKAINYIINEKENIDRVAFIDDDTLIDKDWHKEMIKAAIRDGDKIAHSTLVKFFSNQEMIQSAGHIFKNYKPFDVAYKDSTPINIEPICPCGNSAFVPWNAIMDIKKIDDNVWDPSFDQWMTCFDFGLKLKLCGYNTKIANTASATHEGYLNNLYNGKKLNELQVFKQIRSRFLLYRKFFPENEYNNAILVFKESYQTWINNGHPSFEYHIIGQRLECLINDAKMKAEEIYKLKCNSIWKEKMKKMTKEEKMKILHNIKKRE